jgi:hypothetical protein
MCAMTGRPAETWRKFKFATVPGWVYALLALACIGLVGALAFIIVQASIARRASGYLPLTRASNRNLALARWLPAVSVLAGIVLLVAAGIVAKATGGPEPGYKPAFSGLTGNDITSATTAIDPSGTGWVVNVTFTKRGADLFASLTRSNIAACPGDPNTTPTAICAERHLGIWVNLSQRDIDNWEDSSYVAQVAQPFDPGCRSTATAARVCPKLVIDVLTLTEIDGGNAVINGGGNGFTQKAANDLAAAIKPASQSTSPAANAAALLLLGIGIAALIAGLIASVVVRIWIGPKAFVMEQYPGYFDKLVELRNVHPAFVAAVNQIHSARSAQDPTLQAGGGHGIPSVPGSN